MLLVTLVPDRASDSAAAGSLVQYRFNGDHEPQVYIGLDFGTSGCRAVLQLQWGTDQLGWDDRFAVCRL